VGCGGGGGGGIRIRGILRIGRGKNRAWRGSGRCLEKKNFASVGTKTERNKGKRKKKREIKPRKKRKQETNSGMKHLARLGIKEREG